MRKKITSPGVGSTMADGADETGKLKLMSVKHKAVEHLLNSYPDWFVEAVL